MERPRSKTKVRLQKGSREIAAVQAEQGGVTSAHQKVWARIDSIVWENERNR